MSDLEAERRDASGAGEAGHADADWEEPFPRVLVPVPPAGTRPSRELMIRAARLRAAGREWGDIADEIGLDVHEAANWPFYYPEAWEAIYVRAEKEALDLAAARATRKLLDDALGDPDDLRAEAAARALLAQRARSLPRRRPRDTRDRRGRIRYPPRPKPERRVPDPATLKLIYNTVRCRAWAQDWEETAQTLRRPLEDVWLLPFDYPWAWDLIYARGEREVLAVAAAAALERLERMMRCGDGRAPARAARTILIHQARMRRRRTVEETEPPRRQERQDAENKDQDKDNASSLGDPGDLVVEKDSPGDLAVDEEPPEPDPPEPPSPEPRCRSP